MSLKPDLPLPEPKTRRVGYAIVGIGELSADELIPAARTSEHAYVAALVTGDVEKGRAFAQALDLSDDDVYTYEQFEQLKDREDVEAVYIVLPNSLHREYVERAAKMGKQVLCEKPLGVSADDARAMVQACQDAGVLLMTAYRCQYTPEYWAVRDAVQSGRLGTIRALDSINAQVQDDPAAWRLKKDLAGGGALPDIGLYSLNTVRFVMAEEPQWVFAQLNQPQDDERFTEVEERLSWMMGFSGGVVATCQTSYAAQRVSMLRVLGEKGMALMDPAFDYQGLKVTLEDQEGQHQPAFPSYDQFGNEFDHFAGCIRSGQTPWTPGEEGVADHVVMDALYESARTGQRVDLKTEAGKDLFRGQQKPQLPEG
ncbi:Gfo/Idh/MocA family protein [Deinococcus sp. Marseille-Q6407]|uniref:Gfo/Idh/MocA family protein n=1 Tax=Deinococcus sp. Marseille-Q6407 TaxID=2969223 RepID=UPI0021BDF883|nr:Gfo/Idh/MocA family oxidoreductase [Deinococcus sp. Marseille-Q6407]